MGSSQGSCNASTDVASCYSNWAAGGELKDLSVKNKNDVVISFFLLFFPIVLWLVRKGDAAGAEATAAALGASVAAFTVSLLLVQQSLVFCYEIVPCIFGGGDCQYLGAD